MSLYAHPRLYDALQAGDTSQEADLLERIHREHGNGGRDWLEPACGTGRLVVELSRRGWNVAGYDREPRMLAYARRRAGPRVERGDLRSFCRPASWDFAYSLEGSFRHLESDRYALAHLRATARSLRPGGLYALGLDLTDYRFPEEDEETWEGEAGGRSVRQVQMALPADRRRRLERILQFVSIGRRLLRERYDLRTYDAAEFRRLVARSPFGLAAVYDLWGRRTRLSSSTRAAIFVLRKKWRK
ncbi:MAG: class I SAM-dependent methyltransferase [Elusimicrobia bacterium]|nr:class I SAM-dependent methyltransferase [Elusimicrobiota bacterium]